MPTRPSIEVRAGVLAILPAVLAVIPFALLLGARASEQGLSPLEVGLMSVIAPMVFLTGPAEAIAAGLTLFLAFRLPLLATVVVGVVAVVVLRAMLG